MNHIDGNKLNNHVDNLEWCDRHHNMQHAAANGLCGGFYGNQKLVPSEELDAKILVTLATKTMSEAARDLKVHYSTLYRYLNKRGL